MFYASTWVVKNYSYLESSTRVTRHSSTARFLHEQHVTNLTLLTAEHTGIAENNIPDAQKWTWLFHNSKKPICQTLLQFSGMVNDQNAP